jgi:hypothetical protein
VIASNAASHGTAAQRSATQRTCFFMSILYSIPRLSSNTNTNTTMPNDCTSCQDGGDGFLRDVGRMAIPLGLYASGRLVADHFPSGSSKRMGRAASPKRTMGRAASPKRRAGQRGGSSIMPAPVGGTDGFMPAGGMAGGGQHLTPADYHSGGAAYQRQQELVSSEFRRIAGEIQNFLSKPKMQLPARRPSPRRPAARKPAAAAPKKKKAAPKKK